MIPTGKYLEKQAELHLIRQGLKLVTRNFYCRDGEIDLIFLDRGQFVFTEVRGRSLSAFGSAHESITKAKQKKLIKTAAHYIHKNPKAIHCRFDVITFLIEEKNSMITIKKTEWLKNAIYTDNWAW